MEVNNGGGLRGIIIRGEDGRKFTVSHVTQITMNKAEVKLKTYNSDSYVELTKL